MLAMGHSMPQRSTNTTSRTSERPRRMHNSVRADTARWFRDVVCSMPLPIAALFCITFFAGGCGLNDTAPDASVDGALSCGSNDECDDGRFCNGAERCDPSSEVADARGCVAPEAPRCASGCDEVSETCDRCVEPDADDDGHAAVACGGDDCDDTDSGRFPGAVEVCDPVGRDEDCDPTTVGVDGDGDGEAHLECCQRTDTGVRCGTDCDDRRATVNTTAIESCNSVDEDCDGRVDETSGLFPDCDRDGFGDPSGVRSTSCNPVTGPACPIGGGEWSDASGDCDDTRAFIYPAAPETCNGRDDDCDGVADTSIAADAWCNEPSRALTNATAVCVEGVCAVAACTGPFLDCTHGNGCETDPATSHTSCSICGNECAFGCVSGACDDVVSIAVGIQSGCVVRESGKVFCWGNNDLGQLGDGSTVDRQRPTEVADLTGAIQVAAFYRHTCARRAAGDVMCWGENTYGQLGDGTTTNRLAPTSVNGIVNAVEVDVGSSTSCARLQSGSVMCWGRNLQGQVGDGTTNDRTVPTLVDGLTDAVDLAVGENHACAVRATGGVVCWGYNQLGQLGNGTTTRSLSPGPVVGLSDAVEVAAGVHVCARRTSGAMACWGMNDHGQLGTGSSGVRSLTPVAVAMVSDATQVAVGGQHTCALKASGGLVCWGRNYEGQLGIGTTTPMVLSPVAPLGLLEPVEIGAGSHTCALESAGSMWCWGPNDHGQLGTGSGAGSSLPLQVRP